MRIDHLVTKFTIHIITKDDIVTGCITCTIKFVYIHVHIQFMISLKKNITTLKYNLLVSFAMFSTEEFDLYDIYF